MREDIYAQLMTKDDEDGDVEDFPDNTHKKKNKDPGQLGGDDVLEGTGQL